MAYRLRYDRRFMPYKFRGTQVPANLVTRKFGETLLIRRRDDETGYYLSR
jgi:hypothetical protein